MPVLESIIPQQWWMQQFSFVENFVIKQKPAEEWFRKQEFSLVKRDWTSTNEDWITDGEIVWHIKYENKIYVWDDLGKIYRYRNNGWSFQFDKVFDNPWNEYSLFTENINWTIVRQKAIRIPYLSWLSASWTVVTAPNDPWSTPYTLVVSEEIFTQDSVNKYVYVPVTDSLWALQDWRFQFARIIKYNSTTSVDLEFAFLGWGLSVVAWNKIEVYDTIANNILFNNIRKTEEIDWIDITTTVCLNDNDEDNPEITYRSIYWDDILYLEWKVWTVNNWLSISASIPWLLEVVDSLSVLWDTRSRGTRNFQDSILAIEDYQKYILVFFSDSISVIRQIAYDADSGETLYWFNQAISWMTLFSATSLWKKSWALFIVNKDKQIGTISVNPISESSFTVEFSDQWYVMQDLFNDNIIEWDHVFIASDNITTNIVVAKLNQTIVYRYYPVYQRWLPQKYPFRINTWFQRFFWYDYYTTWTSLVRWEWEDDLWQDIPQTMSIVWPQTEWQDGRLCYMQQIVLWVWFFNNLVDFDLELEMWTDRFIMVLDRTVWGTEYVRWQNITSGDWSLWTNILWYNNLWWANIMRENISKMSILWFKVWVWFAWYFKLTMRNKGNANINISLIEFQYVPGNPYLVPIKNSF